MNIGVTELPIWPSNESAEATETVVERGNSAKPDRKIENVATATLTLYMPERATGDAVVVCPGGGYAGISIDREGHDVCRWLAREGIAALVLKYRLGRAPDKSPRPLVDVLQAIALTRRHAGEWGIDDGRIGIMGFSAGGHMAAHATNEDSRLMFAVLVYPLVSMEAQWTHHFSRRHLLGRWPRAASVRRYSMEYGVSAHTAPTFLVHARDDDVVTIANSQRYAAALQQHGIAHRSLFFEQGGHGFGLGETAHGTNVWPAACLHWLREKGLLATPSMSGSNS